MVIIMNHEKNNIDRFLDNIEKRSNKKVQYIKVYEKPTKAKCIIGFVFSLIFMVILLGLFSFNLMYFVLLIGCGLVLVFFGVNLFTEKGFGLPKTIAVEVKEEQPENEEEMDEDDTR